MFFEFLNYDWEHSYKFHNYCKVHPFPENKSKEDQEAFKRSFYMQKVDKNLEDCFSFEREEDKERFLKTSWLFQNLGSLSGCYKSKAPKFALGKNLCYAAFLLSLPLNLPGKGLLFGLAVTFSVLERYGALLGDMRFYAKVLLEEETSNLLLLAMGLLAGSWLHALIQLNLVLYAAMSTALWFKFVLEQEPNTPGLALFRPQVLAFLDERLKIIRFKAGCEVFIGFAMLPMVLLQMCAPLFLLFYFHYLKMKFMASFFVKEQFQNLDALAAKYLPRFLYAAFVANLKRLLLYFVDYEKEVDELV